MLSTVSKTTFWICMSSIYSLAVYGETFNSQPEHTVNTVQQQQHHHSSLPQQLQHNFDSLVKPLQTKRSWQNLQGSWGKRSSFDTTQDYVDDLRSLYEQGIDSLDNERNNLLSSSYMDDIGGDDQTMPGAKRAWKSMANGGWGKRLGGVYGKREPGWNNLKGLWGKRANNWNKLQSAWGKRDYLPLPPNTYLSDAY